MNPNPQNRNSGCGEETLRLIANLPAPEGLEERVHAALQAAPRRGHLLSWPGLLRPESSWMRAAAAAAIVFVVAGGGWGVYTRVQQGQPVKVIAMPPRVPAPGGFSSSGAMRTPQTIPGPTVMRPAKAHPAQAKATKKPAAHAAPTRVIAQPTAATAPAVAK